MPKLFRLKHAKSRNTSHKSREQTHQTTNKHVKQNRSKYRMLTAVFFICENYAPVEYMCKNLTLNWPFSVVCSIRLNRRIKRVYTHFEMSGNYIRNLKAIKNGFVALDTINLRCCRCSSLSCQLYGSSQFPYCELSAAASIAISTWAMQPQEV